MLEPALDHSTVGERAYRRIREDIVLGRLAPGQKLVLDRMRDAYSASVSTLREILNRLSSQGLVLAEGARGFEVTPISPANLREVAALRCLLEGHAMRESFAAGDMDWEGRVVSAHHKLAAMERHMAEGAREHAATWKRYDREFHHALISACGSRLLVEMHATVYDLYLRYQMVAAVFRGEIAADEHRALLRFALARDWQGAKATLEQHVQGCVAHMIGEGLVG